MEIPAQNRVKNQLKSVLIDLYLFIVSLVANIYQFDLILKI